MPVSVGYIAKETTSNLWRNRMMALAAILTVAVSLSLVGASLLLKQSVTADIGQWQNNVNLDIFMQGNATAPQIGAVKALTHNTPQIRSCTYLDQQASHNLMKTLLKSDEIAVESVPVNQTPPLFQCTLTNPSDAATVASEFNAQPGMLVAQYPGKSIKVMQEVSNVIQTILLVIALLLMVSSLVLILNAIRMAIFARRKEVGVMKLVGATNWFIRIPFMLEGLFQGLLGALVAAGVVILANKGIQSLVKHFGVTALQSAFVSSHQVVMTVVLVLVVGTIVGTLGSALAVRRYLDV